MVRLVVAMVVGIAKRRLAVAFLLGLACVGYGRYLRANANEWSRFVVTVTSSGTETKPFDPVRFESYREDGLCLIVFGLVISVISVAVWLWREPAPVPQLPPPDSTAEPPVRSGTDF